jgi:hypothetical protein
MYKSSRFRLHAAGCMMSLRRLAAEDMMTPLYDMLELSRNGQAFEILARQFGLTEEQTRSAIAALMPAFGEGLRRQMADPARLAALFGALSSGQHGRFFDDPGAAASPPGIREGNALIDQIFGSNALTQAVSTQAASMAGISQEIMREMMPAVAALMMGALQKQASGQAGSLSAGADDWPVNPLQAMFDAITGQEKAGGTSRYPREAVTAQNPLEAFMRGFLKRVGTQAEQKKPVNPSGRPRNPYDDLFAGFFETGARLRDDYQRSMRTLFDQFMRDMQDRRK